MEGENWVGEETGRAMGGNFLARLMAELPTVISKDFLERHECSELISTHRMRILEPKQ